MALLFRFKKKMFALIVENVVKIELSKNCSMKIHNNHIEFAWDDRKIVQVFGSLSARICIPGGGQEGDLKCKIELGASDVDNIISKITNILKNVESGAAKQKLSTL